MVPALGFIACWWWGCAGPESRIQPRDGPLGFEIRYPQDGVRILQDSTAIWGTVGTGGARLELNGRRVRTEANGAFADFVPLPAGDTVTLEFVAKRGKETVRHTVRVLRTAPPARPEDPVRPYSRWVRLSRMPNDTVDSATQARPVYTRWRPGGGLALPIEQGIRLPTDLRTDDAYRLRVAPGLFMWAAASEVDTLAGQRQDLLPITDLRVESDADEVDVSVAVSERIPTSVEAVPGGLVWTLFGRFADDGPAPTPPRGFVREMVRQDAGAGRAEIALTFEDDPLGWKVVWLDGRLVLRVRTPRPLEAGLRDLVVALDPGHPPGGTTGPDGLQEDSMTLAVARVAADRLRALGARPVLLRDSAEPVSLDERIVRAESAGACVYVSIHGNSPGPGRPPWAVFGATVYWVSPNAFTLGRAMLSAVATAMDQPSIGLVREDFAVIRTTWYPAVLVEGTGMVMPEQEAFLRSPDGIAAYADGIVAGLNNWVTSWGSGVTARAMSRE